MRLFFDTRRPQDILFVCGIDRAENSAAIVSELKKRKSDWIACFAETGNPSLNVAGELQLARFEVDSAGAANFASAVRNAEIAVLEGLPCALSEIVATTWQANCDLIGEIVAATIDDAFRQVRVHFLKHGFGDTASRAERVRVIFDGRDVTAEFRAFEERTRLRYPPMNTHVANPGSRDNYHM
jgi:hypothetical protein